VAAYTVEVYDHGTPEENFKRGLLCYGPVLVQSSRMDHDFILVGWDDTNSSWIFKNSWGTGFEDNGYGKIPYGSNNTDFLNRAYLFVNGVYNESIY
jgi:C1A family cysteine protease